MSHPDVEKLSALLDGDLDPGEAGRLREHLDGCAACSKEMDSLRGLVATLRGLPDRQPATDPWPGIRGKLGPPPLLSTVRLTAAAAVLVLAIAGAWLFVWRSPPTDPGATSHLALDELERARVEGYLAAIRDVEDLLTEMDAALDPASTRLVREELRVLDGAIADLRQALEADPDNLWLRERLARSLQTKWTYLREAAELVPPRFDSGG